MENHITKAGLVLVLVLTGTQIMQAGDILDDMATYYARETRPFMKKYYDRQRFLRNFKVGIAPIPAEEFGSTGFAYQANRMLPKGEKRQRPIAVPRFRNIPEDERGYVGEEEVYRQYLPSTGWIKTMRSYTSVDPNKMNSWDVYNYVNKKVEEDRPTWGKFTAPFYNWYYRK